MRVGASVWPFQWDPPYEEALSRIARLGFRAVELIAMHKVSIAPLMSAHFPLEEYHRTYDFLDEARDLAMKVFIDVAP